MVWWPVRTASAPGLLRILAASAVNWRTSSLCCTFTPFSCISGHPGICSTCCKVINSAWVCPRVFHALSEGWMRL